MSDLSLYLPLTLCKIYKKSNDRILRYFEKSPILGKNWLSKVKRIFKNKSGFFTFVHLWSSNHAKKPEKNEGILKKKMLRTNERSWIHRTPSAKPGWSKKWSLSSKQKKINRCWGKCMPVIFWPVLLNFPLMLHICTLNKYRVYFQNFKIICRVASYRSHVAFYHK